MSTRGTAETRKIEATNAAEILGVHVRENLKMADGFFQNDEQHQRKIIETIRKYQPTVILCNAPEDRHPDHGRSAKLVSDAAFLSGLRKIVTNYDGKMQDAWRPTYVFHYIQARYLKPDFIVDISAYHEIKLKSILAYTTQFHDPNSSEPQTFISSPQFLESVKSRDLMWGQQIGVRFAEGFISEKVLGVKTIDTFIQNVT